MEMKARPSGSSSDSGIVLNESVVFGDVNLGSKINISTINQDVEYKNDSETSVNTINAKDSQQCTIMDVSNLKNSPVSTYSNKISIESINEDANSSIIDSDSDFEDMPTNGNFIIERLGQHAANSDRNGIIIVSQNQDSTGSTVAKKPNIGSIAVQNSSDITFGDKTFYQGPVTIKQFLLDNNKWKPKDSNGNINPAFDTGGSDKRNESSGDLRPVSPVDNKFKFDRKVITITGIGMLITIIVLSVTSILYIKSKSLDYRLGDGDDSRKNNPINSTIGTDNIGGGKVLRIVSRIEWVAQPPRSTLNDLELPATRVIIAHTATEFCTTQAKCTFHVRFIQTFHMESRNWDDIGYNFLVGGDGAIYEGRGWDKEGAHTKGFNKRSICIAFIGTFNDVVPPEKQLNAAKLMLEEGVKLQKISPNYKLYGHRQLIPSESPGKTLYEIIQKWPHWSDDISDV